MPTDHTKHIYTVRDGCAIYWPNGKLRGTGGYVVRGDDQFLTRYFRNAGQTPAMMELTDGATPVPPSEWPAQYRNLAGEQYATPDEIESRAKAEKVAAETERKKAKAAAKVSTEIPPVDED